MALIAERAAKGGGKKKKAAKKKAPAKKAAKAPAKKAGKKRRRPRRRPPRRRKLPTKAEGQGRGGRRVRLGATQTGDDTTSLDKARVLEILSANPGATKRDVARQLGLKGNDRIALKRILKELEDEGAIERGKKRSYRQAGRAAARSPFWKSPARTMTASCWRARSAGSANEPPPKIIVVPGRDDRRPRARARANAFWRA